MKKTLKRIAALLAALMTLGALASCGTNKADAKDSSTDVGTAAAASDMDYVKGKKEMIIGITYFAPMDYFDTDGTTLIGFDHDLAVAVCEKLGVTPKFQEIDWSKKEIELNAKTIDCIWNGMTVDSDRAENMALTSNYMKNRQVIVVKKDMAESITSVDSLKGLTGAAEDGSAGESVIKANDELAANYVASAAQSDAVLEVKAGTVDYCVIDSVMAKAMISAPGSEFSDLTVVETVKLADDEFYAVAFRKGSDLAAKVSSILSDLAKDGTIDEIAGKYGLTDVIVK